MPTRVEKPVRVAFAGKGGAGKSALAGSLCRVLARRGHRVLALDADSVPGLAAAIGLAPTDDWLLASAAAREEGKGFRLTMTPAEAIERFALEGPDGVRFLQFGKLTAPMTAEQRPSAHAFLEILHAFRDDGWSVVADLAAGTRQPYYGWLHETLLAVVEPSAHSLLTARRLLRLREVDGPPELLAVANKVASAAERRRIARELEAMGIPLWAEVPADPLFAEAERAGRPPVELGDASPAIRAVEEIADRLLARDSVADARTT